LMDPFMMN
jgi:hypothetical protein